MNNYKDLDIKKNVLLNTPENEIARIPADEVAELICFLVSIREHQLTNPQRKTRQFLVYALMISSFMHEGSTYEEAIAQALQDSQESNYKTIRSDIFKMEQEAIKANKTRH
jgi:hypothetical protein